MLVVKEKPGLSFRLDNDRNLGVAQYQYTLHPCDEAPVMVIWCMVDSVEEQPLVRAWTSRQRKRKERARTSFRLSFRGNAHGKKTKGTGPGIAIVVESETLSSLDSTELGLCCHRATELDKLRC